MGNIKAMVGKILVKKHEVQEESNGFLLNNEAEQFLSCGEIIEDMTVFISDPCVNRADAEVHQITLHEGDKVYYQKSKGYDTHNPDYQVINIADIIYVEEA